MIDVAKHGEQHVQVFWQHGLSVHSCLMTTNQAYDLIAKLQRALCEPVREPAETLADE